MSTLVILPLLVPLIAGAALAVAAPVRLRLAISAAAAVANALAAGGLLAAVHREGILVMTVGGWPPPYGIPFVADLLAALMVGIASLVALASLLVLLADPERREARFAHAGWHLMLAGMNGAFLTGDLFNLYVFFEVMLIASYFLVTLGASPRQARQAFIYVAMNLLASTLFLMAVAALYAATGTLNMADLFRRLPDAPVGLRQAGVVLLATAFSVKAAVFPLYFWLPHTYVLPVGPIAAYLGGMLTKVGIYALFRLLGTLHPIDGPQGWLLLAAGLTMTLGVLGALAQNSIRAVLVFHIVSQIGYLIMALGLHSPLAMAAGIFYILHVIAAKTALLLVAAVVERVYGTGELDALEGVARSSPALAWLFLISAFALSGLPPLSGFWAKFGVVRAGLESGQPAIAAVAVGVSLLTLLSMMKIFTNAFWGKASAAPVRLPALAVAGTAGMAALTVLWGVAAHPLFALAAAAAAQLLDPGAYAAAVLGVR